MEILNAQVSRHSRSCAVSLFNIDPLPFYNQENTAGSCGAAVAGKNLVVRRAEGVSFNLADQVMVALISYDLLDMTASIKLLTSGICRLRSPSPVSEGLQ